MIASRTLKRAIRSALPPRAWYWIRRAALRSLFDEVEFVHSLLKDGVRGRLMVDVGSHRGESLLPFALDGWIVEAFEPDPQTATELHYLVKRLPCVTLHHEGVSDTAGSLLLYKSEKSSGITSFVPFHDSHVPSSSVPVVCLREAIGPRPIDFLKIDTEGFELNVLRGLDWATQSPGVIVAEFEDNKTARAGYSTIEMMDFIRMHGYHILISEWEPILEYGGTHMWRRFRTERDGPPPADSWGNVIAFKDPVVYQKALDAASRSTSTTDAE